MQHFLITIQSQSGQRRTTGEFPSAADAILFTLQHVHFPIKIKVQAIQTHH